MQIFNTKSITLTYSVTRYISHQYCKATYMVLFFFVFTTIVMDNLLGFSPIHFSRARVTMVTAMRVQVPLELGRMCCKLLKYYYVGERQMYTQPTCLVITELLKKLVVLRRNLNNPMF